MLDFRKFKVLSFDCYGTLIDWEKGILKAVRPVLESHGIRQPDAQVLDLYAQLESQAEGGEFKNYKSILRAVMKGIGEETGFEPAPLEMDCLVEAVPKWRPFPDTVRALKELKKRYKLAILSNIDDDLIAHSIKHLQVEFDWVITAQQVKSYKPSLNNFQEMIHRLGMPKGKILHVAQSIYHDIVPAKRIGLSAIWVNRRKHLEGSGATPPDYAEPDFEVPDLASLAAKVSGKMAS
jgi:2-haloacid dehalogenase